MKFNGTQSEKELLQKVLKELKKQCCGPNTYWPQQSMLLFVSAGSWPKVIEYLESEKILYKKPDKECYFISEEGYERLLNEETV